MHKDALLPLFDAVYGSSAGALNAAWLICGRAESTMPAWWDPMIMGTTINPRRLFRRQPVVDTRYLVHTVYTEIMPMGFQEILDSPVELHPIATDALTGRPVDLHSQIHDQASLQSALRASSAMPLLAGDPVVIDGHPYVDAGLSEGTPVRTALAQQATHIVAFRTRRVDETQSAPTRPERLLMTRWFTRHAPGALEPWLNRVHIRAEEDRLLSSHPATLVVRPHSAAPPSRAPNAALTPQVSRSHRPPGRVRRTGPEHRIPALTAPHSSPGHPSGAPQSASAGLRTRPGR